MNQKSCTFTENYLIPRWKIRWIHTRFPNLLSTSSSQNPNGWHQRSAGGSEEDCKRWVAGKHLGPSAHGQDRSVTALQSAVWWRHREVRVLGFNCLIIDSYETYTCLPQGTLGSSQSWILHWAASFISTNYISYNWKSTSIICMKISFKCLIQ